MLVYIFSCIDLYIHFILVGVWISGLKTMSSYENEEGVMGVMRVQVGIKATRVNEISQDGLWNKDRPGSGCIADKHQL